MSMNTSGYVFWMFDNLFIDRKVTFVSGYSFVAQKMIYKNISIIIFWINFSDQKIQPFFEGQIVTSQV